MANSNRICSVPECNRTVHGYGFCFMHYKRLRLYGSLSGGSTPRGELQTFYRDVVLTYEGDDCLSWPYGTKDGYGVMKLGGKMVTVSRALCEEAYGPPPTLEHQAAHSCGKGHLGCVAKRHLSWKSPSENNIDKLQHGTHNRGERNPLSKLSEQHVREILYLKGRELQKDTAARYGVSRRTVSHIQKGTRWAWVTAL